MLVERGVGGGPALPAWQLVASARDLAGALWVCVSPASAHYDDKAGLELDRPGWWMSSEHPIARRNLTYRYRRESYDEHIGRVLAQFDGQRRACEVATARLAGALDLPTDALEGLARLSAALHDVAKLTPGWQDAAWRWQTELHRTPRAGYLAHTDQDRSDPIQRRRLEEGNYRLPSHAPEGGFAASPALQAAVDKLLPADTERANEISRALFSAIARHHGASTRTLEDFALPAAARRTAALVQGPEPAVGGFEDHPSAADRAEFADWLTDPRASSLGFLLYWYVSRRLRLADQRATAEASQ